jgi:UDP-N-acetylglucosamine diphosphorylase / glucose-1-phosphate thymidylyltransferase / UDP-N-acetylgalactosamine diphosphorylase / glucosamine-1-phosphate N-acetyltransferase / galactosamine-1-phosphate N-acetyltransferase
MPVAAQFSHQEAKKLASTPIQTLLLLAGRSRRFWPLAEKSLWPFLGKPLLHYQVERLQRGGLTNINFVGGHHNLEEVNALFPKMPAIEQENLDLGMRGALLSALPHMKGQSVCIVSNNDVIESQAYEKLLAVSRQPGVDGAILAQRVKRYFPGGYLMTGNQESGIRLAPRSLGEGGNQGEYCPGVIGVIEKPGEGKEPSDLVNIVAHVHNHPAKLLEALEDVSSSRDDAYEVALTALCKEFNYVAVPYEGRWDAVKYPWHILDVTERFLSELSGEEGERGPFDEAQGKKGKGDIHPTAVIEGPVVLEEGVRVFPHATIQGPCYIGRGTVIGTNALVRDSIIGERCVIGFSSEVARSNLHSHVWAHSTYIGDSVIGRNVGFGAGSVVANLRLDEGEVFSEVSEQKINTQRTKSGVVIGNDVRIGIHASFAPGVKIGRGSFISSATYVSRDVEDGRYVHAKEGILEERENTGYIPGVRGGGRV